MIYYLMSTNSRLSRHLRGQSLEFDPLLEIGRKKEIVENLQSKLRRSFSDSSSEITGISISFPPWKLNMTSSGGGSSSNGSTSSQASTSSLIGSMYSHHNYVVTTNQYRVIK